MRLPSIDLLVSAARRTLARFPMVLLAAVVAAAGAVVAVGARGTRQELYIRVFLTATLGLPLFLAVGLYVERKAWTAIRQRAAWGLGTGLLLAFFVAWPSWSEPVRAARYVQCSAGLHLLVAFLPYAGANEPNGFWQYNKAVMLRFLSAALHSAVLYGGLAIALLAVDRLLGIHVAGETYVRLWVVIALVFNTWFFLGGVPADLGALEQRADYPPGLKVFTQYLLIPIVAIYLLILTTYVVKIGVTRVWPSGWIGYLVSSVAVLGILSLLLVYPIAERAENRWIQWYSRWFYLLLFPSLVALWLAIGKRVDQYGITERRYFLTVLSVWLAGIAVYYTMRRSRNIKVIPASLCALAFVTFAGPWGAYGVSRASQLNRLETLLARNHLVAEGSIRSAAGEVAFEDRKEISAVLRYLIGTHGARVLAGRFGGWLIPTDTAGGGRPPAPGEVEARARPLVTRLGLEYVGRWEQRAGHFSYYPRRGPQLVRISGYDYALRADALLADSVPIGEDAVVTYVADSAAIRIARRGATLIDVPLRPVLVRVRQYMQGSPDPKGIPRDLLKAEAESRQVRVAIYVTAITGRETDRRLTLSALSVELFLKLK